MKEILLTIAVATVAYLLGCISTGILIARASGVNIREVGSKNTGASNVLRVMGLKKGLFTFLGDFFKAALACFIGSLLLPNATFGIEGFGRMLGGLFAIVGHNWPVFFGFRGGKGVACSAAVIFFVNPLWGGISIVVCIAVIAALRYISVGSMTMLLCYAILMCIDFWGQWFPCLFAVLLLMMCVYRHHPNIVRLLNGTENKIGHKAPASPAKDEEA